MPNPNLIPELATIKVNVSALPEFIQHNQTVTTPLIEKLASLTGLPVLEVSIPAIRVGAPSLPAVVTAVRAHDFPRARCTMLKCSVDMLSLLANTHAHSRATFPPHTTLLR